MIPISGNGGGAFKIKLPATEGITIEQIEGDIDISCCLNDEEFMAVDGKNIDKITMEEEKGVSIEGTNAEYTASIGAKDEENTLVQSEGKVDGEVVYSYNNGRIDIEGENVKDTTITTISGDAESKQLSESEAAVTSVKLDKKKATVAKGSSLTLKPTISPSDASNKAVSWKTSDKKIATVSSKGVVKGVRKGTVTITVTTKDKKKKATCKVTVK